MYVQAWGRVLLITVEIDQPNQRYNLTHYKEVYSYSLKVVNKLLSNSLKQTQGKATALVLTLWIGPREVRVGKPKEGGP